MKTMSDYLQMSAAQILAEPDAPESLKIRAQIEIERGQARDKPPAP